MRNTRYAILTLGKSEVQNLRTTSITTDQIDLAWDAPDSLAFEVQRKIDDGTWQTIGTTAVNEKIFNDTTFDT